MDATTSWRPGAGSAHAEALDAIRRDLHARLQDRCMTELDLCVLRQLSTFLDGVAPEPFPACPSDRPARARAQGPVATALPAIRPATSPAETAREPLGSPAPRPLAPLLPFRPAGSPRRMPPVPPMRPMPAALDHRAVARSAS